MAATLAERQSDQRVSFLMPHIRGFDLAPTTWRWLREELFP